MKRATLVPLLCVFLGAATAHSAPLGREREAISPAVCTLRGDVCVRGARASTLWAVAEALSAAQARVRLSLHLSPNNTLRAGGALQVHVVAGVPRSRFVTTGRDPLSAFDRALGELEFPEGLQGQALAVEAERAVLHAVRASKSPGGNTDLERAEVEALAGLLSARALEEPLPTTPRMSVHGAPFWSWLDGRTAHAPGDFLRGAWAAAASQTPSGSEEWLHEPDLLDVARTTLRAPGYGWSELGPALLDYEAERLGPPGTRDWELPWEGKTRRIYAPGDMVPYAVSRVVIRKPPVRLRVEWEWEQHAHFTLLVLGLDAKGSIERRVWVHSPSRGTNVSYTFGGLEPVAELVLLAVNTGDPDRPYDPEEQSPEPHRLSITYADADALGQDPTATHSP